MSRRIRVGAACAAVAIALGVAVAAPLVAADPVADGGPFLIAAKPDDVSFLHTPAAAYDPTRDRFLVVMFAGPASLFAQLTNAAGQPVGAPFRIEAAQNTYGDEVVDGSLANGDHDVVYNPSTDQFFVTWSQSTGRNTLGPLGARWNTVYGQHVNAATGAVLGEPQRLNEIRGDSAWCSVREPVAEYNPADHGYLVVWTYVLHNGHGGTEHCPGFPATDAYVLEVARISSGGTPVGTPTMIPGSGSNGSGSAPYPSLVRHSSGEFLLLQRVIRSVDGTATTHIVVRRISSSGALVGAPVEPSGFTKGTAVAAERPDGNWLVLGYGGGGAVTTHVYTPAMEPVGTPLDVFALGGQVPSGVHEVVALGDGTFALADASLDIFHLTSTGAPIGPRLGVALTGTLVVSRPGAPALAVGRGHTSTANPTFKNAMVGQLVRFQAVLDDPIEGIGPVDQGDRVCVDVAGNPGDVALVNLTPIGASGLGNGQLISSNVTNPPVASNVNYGPGTVDPNVAAAPIGTDGKVCYANDNLASVHLIADHLGTIDANVFTPPTPSGAPARRIDTR